MVTSFPCWRLLMGFLSPLHHPRTVGQWARGRLEAGWTPCLHSRTAWAVAVDSRTTNGFVFPTCGCVTQLFSRKWKDINMYMYWRIWGSFHLALVRDGVAPGDRRFCSFELIYLFIHFLLLSKYEYVWCKTVWWGERSDQSKAFTNVGPRLCKDEPLEDLMRSDTRIIAMTL